MNIRNGLALVLIFVPALLFTACSPEPAAQTDSVDTVSGPAVSDLPQTDAYPNLVIACDQVKDRVLVYDMAAYDGEDLDRNVVWSFQPEPSSARYVSGVKYREDTVFGDVVLICSSGGYGGIIRYPSGEVVWQEGNCGNNPHSIEILPDGSVAVACSTGGELNLFRTSVLAQDPKAGVTRKTYNLPGAHGCLWDPENEVLWGLGSAKLVAYYCTGEGKSLQLSVMAGMGGSVPEGDGHDLSADMTDVNYLWVTSRDHVYRFDKNSGEFSYKFPDYRTLSRSSVKGFGNNRNNNFFFCRPNGGPSRAWKDQRYAEWCTDSIYYVSFADGKRETRICKSSTCAYYKVFCFYGAYQ